MSTYYHKVKKSYAKKNLILEHKFKTHLLFKEINKLIRNKEILDVAEKFLGPNILCWNSIIFYKKRKSKNYVGWHEDKTYWNLDNNRIIPFQ